MVQREPRGVDKPGSPVVKQEETHSAVWGRGQPRPWWTLYDPISGHAIGPFILKVFVRWR
jgi:hypothetical protein